jgi:hypothetical protein
LRILFGNWKNSNHSFLVQGCPLNKLDIAIAYDLPDILTSYKERQAAPFIPAARGLYNRKYALPFTRNGKKS